MNNGGREAMLQDLLQYDFSGVDLRRFPRTDALMDQVVNSMSPVEKFWYDRLREGTLRKEDDQWKGHVPTEDLYREYIEYAKQIGGHYLLSDSQFGKEVKRLCPQVDKRKPKAEHPSCGNGRKNHYVFPALDECRKAFQQLVNIDLQWS
jgi:phage/plasmid-associated DNA primase